MTLQGWKTITTACIAVQARKTSSENPAIAVGAYFAFDEASNRCTLLARVSEERRALLADDFVEKRFLRKMVEPFFGRLRSDANFVQATHFFRVRWLTLYPGWLGVRSSIALRRCLFFYPKLSQVRSHPLIMRVQSNGTPSTEFFRTLLACRLRTEFTRSA